MLLKKKRLKPYLSVNQKEIGKKNGSTENYPNGVDILGAAKDSIRASMLVRAYRIRGHLISKLDPLELQKREEHPELKPETYGFTVKDLNETITLGYAPLSNNAGAHVANLSTNSVHLTETNLGYAKTHDYI